MMRKSGYSFPGLLVVVWFVFGASWAIAAAAPSAESQAEGILEAAGVKGGLVVHVGCGDGRLTKALRASDSFMVQGLAADAGAVDKARAYLQSEGVYGAVTVDRLTGGSLPYIDNLVNLVVSEDLGAVSMREVMRVLCPGGVAYIKQGSKWVRAVKPWPKEIDEWTHYLHDASNNAVAHDTVIGPPRRMQWVGSPRQSRHHDRMSSVSAAVSAGGRVFYIMDEATPVSILIAPQWSLIARDAFNGTVLWKRPIENWHPHLWPLKSGPAQLPRRLVAVGDRVYVTLDYAGPVTAIDAATGKTVRTYGETAGAEEIIFCDGVLFVLVNSKAAQPIDSGKIAKAYGAKFWDESPRELVAVQAGSGRVLWSNEHTVLPGTLAADAESVYFHNGQSVVCLDRNTGKDRWRSKEIARSEVIRSFYLPILVVYEDVVLFSGGETAGAQTGSWYMKGKDTMTALSTKTGKELWTAYHPPSGYRSAEDLLVVDGLVWTGETTSGRATGAFTGRDPHTGEIKRQFEPDVDIYWFHHRCYRGKATDNYLIMSRAGTEFVDVRNEKWLVNHWVRGACLYGIMPANGMLYNPPNPCACYLESKVDGFNALAPASTGPRINSKLAKAPRLEKGPAWGSIKPMNITDDDWPTYRHDGARSGSGSAVSTILKKAWHTDIGGKLTSPVIAGGMVFVASVDAHIVAAIDASSGRQLWRYTAGGRVDSAPTIWKGRVLFGCRDGWVYCLRASDGKLAWRFRAAPMEQRLTAFEQIESVWPVHGSVLVQNDVLYCVAGRSMFLDAGLRFLRIDPATGRLLSETVLNEREVETGKHIHEYVTWLNMPPALPDILSTDGRLVYMRGLPLNMDGTPLPLEKFPPGSNVDAGAPPATQRADRAHLFSPTGFVDDTWWHRTYWMYGSRFVSGWCGYFLSGKAAPAGRILCFDDDKVYGFGRKPQYYRWTVPIEHHLFAADKMADTTATTRGFMVQHDWTKDLPIFARAMVLAEKTLFVAGPPDLVDEPQAFAQIDEAQIKQSLIEQAAAIEGRKGAVLMAVSTADPDESTQYQLDSPPVFDGMAAAGGRLYMSTVDGKVLCLTPNKQTTQK